MAFGGREGEVKGLVESPVQEELDRNSAEWRGSNSGSLCFEVLLGLCNHWLSGGGCRSNPSGMISKRMCEA